MADDLRLRPARADDEALLRAADRAIGPDVTFALFLDDATPWDAWPAAQVRQEHDPAPGRVRGNAASIATIEAAGGVLDAQRPTRAADHGPVRPYWIR